MLKLNVRLCYMVAAVRPNARPRPWIVCAWSHRESSTSRNQMVGHDGFVGSSIFVRRPVLARHLRRGKSVLCCTVWETMQMISYGIRESPRRIVKDMEQYEPVLTTFEEKYHLRESQI